MDNSVKGRLPSIEVFTSSYKMECQNSDASSSYGSAPTTYYDETDSGVGDFVTASRHPPNDASNSDGFIQHENCSRSYDMQVRSTPRVYISGTEELDRRDIFPVVKADPKANDQGIKWSLAGEAQQFVDHLDNDYSISDIYSFHSPNSLKTSGSDNIETRTSLGQPSAFSETIAFSKSSSDFGTDMPTIYDREMQSSYGSSYWQSFRDNSPSFQEETNALGALNEVENSAHQTNFVQLRPYYEHQSSNDLGVPFNNFYRNYSSGSPQQLNNISNGSPQQIPLYASTYDCDQSSFMTSTQILGNASQVENGELVYSQQDYSDSVYSSVPIKSSEGSSYTLTAGQGENLNESNNVEVNGRDGRKLMFSDDGPSQATSADELEANTDGEFGDEGTMDDMQPTKGRRRGKNDDKSYIALISRAILESPNKRLLLSEIYTFIGDLKCNQRAWRNSVRHNLSLNECFVKEERLGKGRGHYWTIHSACIDDFARGDFRRRQARRKAKKCSLETNKTRISSCVMEFPNSYNGFVDTPTSPVMTHGNNSFQHGCQ